MNKTSHLPLDVDKALLVGRVWRSGPHGGPSVVVVRDGQVLDISKHVHTMADLLDRDDCLEFIRTLSADVICPVDELMHNSLNREAGGDAAVLCEIGRAHV